ncbi:PiggyBac transposable element-derived protein 4 [Merluccius polli]|uniref:PiggyBac transposable element-derived protein 4 n=1 Tax=Merluccius polli TaxID=89951 RepID=A0AA47N875_MERPO|nr:PiggyBac transposable element-derived protein 4 [Merluccius polli]
MAKAVKKEETEVIRESDASHDWSQANSKDEMFSAEGWDPILDRDSDREWEWPRTAEASSDGSDCEPTPDEEPGERWRDEREDDVQATLPHFRPGRRPGPQPSCTQASSPLELFHLFFSPCALDTIVTNTNAYASRKRAAGEPWRDIAVADLYSYFALVIHTGLVRVHDLPDYWRGSRLYGLAFPSRVMSRGRFEAISSALHLSSVDDDAENKSRRCTAAYDPLGKIKPLYSSLATACKSLLQPSQHLVVGQRTVVLGGGGVDKPRERQHKLFILADAASGLHLEFVCI